MSPPGTGTTGCRTTAAAAAGFGCRRSRLGSGRTSAASGRQRRTGRSCGARSTSGITHFDLANNYGPPYGSAERNFGRILRKDLAAVSRRARDLDEGRLRHVAGPIRRVGLPQVPAGKPRPEPRAGWVSNTWTSSIRTASTPTRRSRRRWARSTPRCGRARRCTRESRPTPPAKTREAAAIMRGLGTPILIHQPSYSMLNRWIETEGLLDALDAEGIGCIGFSPLAQGMLSDRYLKGTIPKGSRASRHDSLSPRAPERRDAREDQRAERHRARAGARPSPRWRSPGRSATRV